MDMRTKYAIATLWRQGYAGVAAFAEEYATKDPIILSARPVKIPVSNTHHNLGIGVSVLEEISIIAHQHRDNLFRPHDMRAFDLGCWTVARAIHDAGKITKAQTPQA